ncbi:MAG: hypothetical protein WB812_14825 [Woeseiaceae bacterium]
MKIPFRATNLLLVAVITLLGACSSSTKVTRVQDLAATADAPYHKILVVALFNTFEPRKYLEDEIVKQLSSRGVDAVASTSMMDTTTPMVRETFVDMVRKVGADAVLVTHLMSLDSTSKEVDMRPEATRNFWPTYYWNVFETELTEYVEPAGVEFQHSLLLATEAYSVRTKKPVWAVQTDSKIRQDIDHLRDYSIYVNEAATIVGRMDRDGLLKH